MNFVILSIIWYQLLAVCFGQTQRDLFPFALDTFPSQEILQNKLTRADQEELLASFIGSGVGSFENSHFDEETYPIEDYAIFQGLDDTSMFATSVSISERFAIVGANGYDFFNGAVYVYTVSGVGDWTLQSTIRSPDSFNSNFGLCVVQDGDNIMISANAQSKSLLMIFFIIVSHY
jgi:hypothetical protein